MHIKSSTDEAPFFFSFFFFSFSFFFPKLDPVASQKLKKK